MGAAGRTARRALGSTAAVIEGEGRIRRAGRGGEGSNRRLVSSRTRGGGRERPDVAVAVAAATTSSWTPRPNFDGGDPRSVTCCR